MRIRPGETYSQKEMIQMVNEIDDRLTDLERALNYGNYVTGAEPAQRLREFDINTATPDEMRLVLATLIEDFKLVGRLK